MTSWTDHLIVLPVLLPLIAAAVILPIDERQHGLKAVISMLTTVGTLVAAVVLLGQAGSGTPAVYRLGNWPAPFAIVLVLDRLSALMLVLTSVLGLAALMFSLARWHSAGSHFHSLFLFLLMGLNGAFLTGDLFNLFVFFEILLAASYGLVLHGSGRARVRTGLHYIAVNLVASSLFLIGVSLIYGVLGTLNMADIAQRVPTIAPDDRMLFEAGAAVLGIAFLVKAGAWPLGLWLPSAYSAAAPPIAAFFAIMTKVGVYILLRLSLLILGPEAGASAHFGSSWLVVAGVMTVIYGSAGILASQDLARLASHSLLISAGTLLAVIGMGDVALTEGALFYMVSSTLAVGAFFMLIELAERGRAAGAEVLAVTMEAYGESDGREEDESEEVGLTIPASTAILGLSFVACGLLLAGLPPFSGFLAKFLMLQALLEVRSDLKVDNSVSVISWILVALLLISGFAAVIAFARAGIRSFWLMPSEGSPPRVRMIEMAPIVFLLFLCIALTVLAGPAMRIIGSTAKSLHSPAEYIGSVLAPIPSVLEELR